MAFHVSCLCALLSILMASSMHSPDSNRSTVLREDPPAAARRGVDKPEMMVVAESQEIPKKPEGGGGGHLQFPEKCELKIQVIDDTALIEPSVGNGKLKEIIKSEKKPKRRVRKTRKKKEVLEKVSEKKGKETAVAAAAAMYSRKDLEALRFENFEDQKRKWIEVYCSLEPLVAEEYDGLVVDSPNNNQHHKNCDSNFNFDPRPPMQKSANLFAVAAMVKANPLIITAH